MKHIFPILLSGLLLMSCTHSLTDAEKAQALVDESKALVEAGQLNQALLTLDSIHATYPRCVAERRLAQAVEDTIVYLQAQRTLAYSDSVLETILPQVDPLMKKFRYEKNEQYEDHGKYVHRLLSTGQNTSRCFLQAYVSDDRVTTVKSYYFGAATLDQNAVQLQSGEETVECQSGKAHSFEVSGDGYHSIYTLEGDYALQMLNFISAHQQDRIRINLLGTNKKGDGTNYVYYLNDQEKIALQDTYQLGILMSDIKTLEDAIRRSSMQIERYEKKK